jgi:hypothetical protein
VGTRVASVQSSDEPPAAGGSTPSSSSSSERTTRVRSVGSIAAAAAGARLVDLRVRQRHELAHREGGRGFEEGGQPVLQPRPLVDGGRAGESLQPAVHLQRIGGDGDRILSPLPQQVGQLQRDGGLADAGRPEDGYDGRRLGAQATRARRRSSPASVVLVAESM